MVVSPSIGISIGSLPSGYIRLRSGNNIYYRANDVYYIQQGDEYVVVEEPAGELVAVEYEQIATSSAPALVIPTAGQSPEEIDQDRYLCHFDARELSSYDPSLPAESSVEQREQYYEKFAECLSQKDYVLQ